MPSDRGRKGSVHDTGAPRGWGHFASNDLVRWHVVGEGFAIAPDTPDEASGAYSGCAVPIEAGVRLYYTGNVKEPGDFDYVREGRRSVQILVESPDCHRMGEKRVLLRNADYPALCTRHVRDPKVWRAGAMIRGAGASAAIRQERTAGPGGEPHAGTTILSAGSSPRPGQRRDPERAGREAGS